ncbi:hypothetical protein LWC33_21520 [Pseudonocardia sp. RS11V-5]|uniref:hypothetical protein n=1 Tax=Pseudonocardia terrae TaxID=2905831 RepID=UPI001E339765|nr:hypothetical protein [Pseudonocardia terrae]MCE3554024.1 hypothetical protein [Pseudonocardia terrae]
MLKKAGIVTVGVAASIVAVSPLAFAGDMGHDHHGGHHQSDRDIKNIGAISDDGPSSANGLVAVNALNNADVLKNVNVCPNVDVTAAVSGVLGLLSGPSVAHDAPQAASCDAGDIASLRQS